MSVLMAALWLAGTVPALASPPATAAAPPVPPNPATPNAKTPNAAAPNPASGPAAAAPDDLVLLAAELARATSRAAAADLELRIEQARLRPLSPTTRLLLRRAQAHLADGKPADAVEDLDDALVLQPDAAILWRDRAQARLAIRDLDGTVADLGVAVQHDDHDAIAWQVLSAVEEQRGDWQAAYRAWQHVMVLDPMTENGHAQGRRLHLHAFGQPT
jgi:tetratricopeptide (TPR) repeat protein